MTRPPDPEQLSHAQLLELIRQLVAENQRLREANEQLREEIDRLKRGQAPLSPFAKKDRKTTPRRPGRKRGQGRFAYRRAPAPDTYSAPLLDVPVAHTHCPACGGQLVACDAEIVTTSDLALGAPLVTAYRVAISCCQSCGRRLRGTHPSLPSSQRGATAHRLGTRALAAAHLLHYQLGVPVRKVPRVLEQLTGLAVTQSALSQAALRQSSPQGAVGQAYQQLRQEMRQPRVIHTDDTGWPQGGRRAYLMAFETPALAVYQIRERHRNDEVREVIGDQYAGVLTTDRARSYEAKELVGVKQQKCLAHIQRSLSEVLAEQQGRERDFCEALKSQLKEAQELKRQGGAGSLAAKD